jgi:hypothetical protein
VLQAGVQCGRAGGCAAGRGIGPQRCCRVATRRQSYESVYAQRSPYVAKAFLYLLHNPLLNRTAFVFLVFAAPKHQRICLEATPPVGSLAAREPMPAARAALDSAGVCSGPMRATQAGLAPAVQAVLARRQVRRARRARRARRGSLGPRAPVLRALLAPQAALATLRAAYLGNSRSSHSSHSREDSLAWLPRGPPRPPVFLGSRASKPASKAASKARAWAFLGSRSRAPVFSA